MNRSLDEISERLNFGLAPTSGEPVLYSEESVRGTNTITRNTNGSYSKVDMELLFNAIINNDQTITEILK